MLLLLFYLTISHGQINYPLFHQLMERTYGAERLQVSVQWESLLNEITNLSELDKIKRVNQFFHRHIRYQSDISLWGQEDYWASPLETLGKGAGDCEDYAIIKYVSLRLAGISDDKLRLIYVRAKMGGPYSSVTEAHMVLGYYAEPTAEPLILDSLISTVMPASERTDLSPVFSFNSAGLWAGHTSANKASSSSTSRLSRWRNVLDRMQREGIIW